MTIYFPQVSVATAQAKPSSLNPPQVEVLGPGQLKIMSVEPNKPNGVIILYSMKVIELGQTFNSSEPDQYVVKDLSPYTSYTVAMTVCTSEGCTLSPSVSVTTDELTPNGRNANFLFK